MKINLSPSCINLFYQSPLQFYYNYISKEKPDTTTCDVYSLAGNLVHNMLELYVHKPDRDYIINCFHEAWVGNQLDYKQDIKYNILDIKLYEQSLINGMNIIDKLPKPLETEKKITITFTKHNYQNEYNITGIIDLVYNNNIIDWKTSNNIDDGENFHRQGLHYAYLIYKDKNRTVPNSVIFHYLKINKKVEHSFTEAEIIEYENFLTKFANTIEKAGNDINNYDLGNYENIFNNHLIKCRAEASRRKSTIKIIIKGSNTFLDNPEIGLIQLLIKEFSYEMKDAFWIKKAMLKKGIKNYQPIVRFYNVKYNSLPIGFLNRLKKWLIEHNYKIEIVDERQPLKDYNMPDKLLDRELRDYQTRAVESIMNNKITFLQMATSGGKTSIAAEVIRRNHGLTLFVVDRNVLLTQTAKEFKQMLGQDIGIITEGKMDIRVINVATIQTLNSMIKNKNSELIKLLGCVKVLIIDEGHISASNSYIRLSKYINNAVIRLGMSASYKREDKNEMQIEACVGYPEFQIEAAELIEKGHIMKPKIYFFKYDNIQSTNREYNIAYDTIIVNNTARNNMIVKIYNKFKHKNILIIVTKIAHGKLIQELIPEAMFIKGDVKAGQREEWINIMKKEGNKTIIGTASIISKGLDIRNLDIMVNATGNLSAITTIQSLGRVLRKSDGKNNAFYFDFYDIGIFFREHCEQRMQTLQKQGHKVIIQ